MVEMMIRGNMVVVVVVVLFRFLEVAKVKF